MKIRRKLLILLLVSSLAPLILAAMLHRRTMYHLGKEMSSDAGAYLSGLAQQHLLTLVNSYARAVERDRRSLEFLLKSQARVVERRLDMLPPKSATFYMSRDYDAGKRLPRGMIESPIHQRAGSNGQIEKVRVTYDEQVYHIVMGVDGAAVRADMARLVEMPALYRALHDYRPELLYWQYTAMEGGFHTSYPGHGGYPADYDPRKREWYLKAKEEGGLVWFLMPEVSTGTVTLGLAMPVRRPNGEFAGVTAIDVPVDEMFAEARLPAAWDREAEVMLAYFSDQPNAPLERQVGIVTRGSHAGKHVDWRQRQEEHYIVSQDLDVLSGMISSCRAMRSGVCQMRYKGENAIWAHGSVSRTGVFPLVIVPVRAIVAEATRIEGEMMQGIVRALWVTGALSAVVLVVAILMAIRASRAVTEPVEQLVVAGRQLADGDFHARVDIRTGDELETLGRVFNKTGPQLEERERMKKSLELAMEIQQYLLPAAPPNVDGFDIAGKIVYCDETGGDYYDFIDAVDLGEGKLGVAVGDVTGHGIGAALLMASARAVLRSHAGACGDDLSRLFDVVNANLLRDSDSGQFMTLFYGVLDSRSREFVWTSAGHDPGLWLRHKDGEIEELNSTGTVLGITDDMPFDPAEPITFESGDMLVLSTDGIAETRNHDDECFGRDRLCKVMTDNADRSAAEIYGAIMLAVEEFRQDYSQLDDITLVVIKTL